MASASLANATLGVINTASASDQDDRSGPDTARGLPTKPAIKQDLRLSNQAIEIDAAPRHFVA
jgi:hypothetical protein